MSQPNAQWFREIFDSVNDAILIHDGDTGSIVDVNQRMCELYGYTREEACRLSIADLSENVPPYTQREAFERIQQAGKGEPQLFEWRAKDKSGRLFWVEVNLRSAKIEGKKYFLIMEKDISDRKAAEEEIKKGEEKYRQLVENVDIPILRVDKDGVLLMINNFAARDLGAKPEELIGKRIQDILPAETVERGLRYIQRAIHSGRGTTYEDHLSLGGRERWFRVILQPLKNPDESITSVLFVVRDITEYKSVEHALKESEEQMKAILDNIPDIAWLKDRESRYIMFNEAFAKVCGRTSEEMAGKTDLDGLWPEDLARQYRADDKEVIQAGKRKIIEEPVVDRNGKLTWLETIKTPVFNDRGEIIGTTGIARDITEHKRIEKSLRESEAKLKALLEKSPLAIGWADKEGKLEHLNAKFIELFGYTLADIPTVQRWHELAFGDPASREAVRAIWKKLKIDPGSFGIEIPTIEATVMCKDGSTRYVSIARAFAGEKMMAIYTDLSERKRAEDALRKSEEKYRTLVENVHLGIALNDVDRRILAVNSGLARILGRTPDELIGKKCFWEFEKREQVCAHCPGTRAMATGLLTEVETRGIRADGSEVQVRVQAFPITNPDGSMTSFIEVVEDISERRKNEEALRESEKELEQEKAFSDAIIASIPGLFYVVGQQGRFIRWNKTLAERVGEPVEKISNMSVLSLIHEDDRELIVRKMAEVFSRGNVETETRIRRKDNTVRHYLLTGRRIDISGSAFLVGTGIDITERKQLEEQLRQSQKLEAIGKLAGGIAHDFNNLLNVIIGYSEIILKATEGQKNEFYQDIDEIRNAGRKAASLTTQLLAFSRKQQLRPEKISLNKVVDDLHQMLQRLIGEDIELVTTLEPALDPVFVDPGQNEQVIMNLVINARDAMPNGGKLTITTENVLLDEVSCKPVHDARPGEFVCMTVSDTGIGMDRETQARIFEPFFSTKGPGKGTGLGLAVVYGIIKQQNGWINVSSEPGEGSEFKIFLPVFHAEGEALSAGKISRPEHQNGNGERILLVEDEEGIRSLASRVLLEHNYTVIAAADAQEALGIFEREQKNFHLVFTDSVLPDGSGIDLVNQLVIFRPEIRVLITSGYLDDKSQWSVIHEQGYRFLQKPYHIANLLSAVKETLEKKNRRG